MKANIVRVMAAAFIGLATTAVTVARAGDRVPVAYETNSINTPVVDIAQTFRQLDRDRDGRLSMTEFWLIEPVIGRLQSSGGGVPDQSGYVTRMGPFFGDTNLSQLFWMLDSNRDGMLTQAEFSGINQVLVNFTGIY